LVQRTKDLVRDGLEARDQINILGDDSVPVEYHIKFWKSELIDFGVIQQDSFDDVDMNTPITRQQYMLNKVIQICDRSYDFTEFEEVGTFFKKLINLLKQMNYSPFESEDFEKYESALENEIESALSALESNSSII
jgi:V/A-type H+-transporting ATPase subunit A